MAPVFRLPWDWQHGNFRCFNRRSENRREGYHIARETNLGASMLDYTYHRQVLEPESALYSRLIVFHPGDVTENAMEGWKSTVTPARLFRSNFHCTSGVKIFIPTIAKKKTCSSVLCYLVASGKSPTALKFCCRVEYSWDYV